MARALQQSQDWVRCCLPCSRGLEARAGTAARVWIQVAAGGVEGTVAEADRSQLASAIAVQEVVGRMQVAEGAAAAEAEATAVGAKVQGSAVGAVVPEGWGRAAEAASY